MTIEKRAPSPKERLATLAGRQHGLFTTAQAAALGVTHALITRGAQRGVWERVEPRVYRTGDIERTWVQQLHAACLGAGDGAVASHRGAAALWRLDAVDPGQVELSIPPTNNYRRHIVHRVGDLAEVDATTVDGIPTTTVARTLVDLGSVLSEDELERALESALRRGHSVKRVRWRLEALSGRGRPGAAALRRVIERRPLRAPATGSELETRFVQVLRAAGLPEPVRQHEVWDGMALVGRIDFAYPDRRLAIELDGLGPHTKTFQRDRSRQNSLVLLGWTVLRFTWADVVERPAYVVAVLRSAVAA